MATGRSTKLTSAVGEFLVAAELCRRNLIATPFAGNVPHYDIIASGQFGGHAVIQVKAVNTGNWQFDIRKFVAIEFDGDRQITGDLTEEPYPGLICVLVFLRESRPDRFFVLSWTDLQRIVVRGYTEYLAKHGGARPKAAQSCHCALYLKEIEQFEDNWDLIARALPRSRDDGCTAPGRSLTAKSNP